MAKKKKLWGLYYTSIKFKIQLSGNYQIEIGTTYQILKTYQKNKAKTYLKYA